MTHVIFFQQVFEFLRNPESYYIMCPDANRDKIKLKIENMHVCMKMAKTTVDLLDFHNKLFLSQKPFNIPIIHSDCFFVNVPPKRVCEINQLLYGYMPYTILIGITRDEIIANSNRYSPFAFEQHGLQEFTLLWNGMPLQSRKLQFEDEGGKMRSYRQFLSHLSLTSPNNPIEIDYNFWKSQLFLITYDFPGDTCSGYHRHASSELKKGLLSARMQFEQEQANLSLFVYCSYHKVSKQSCLYLNCDCVCVFHVDPFQNLSITGVERAVEITP